MEKIWQKIDKLLQGIDTEWQLVLLALVLAIGYTLRWLVERHTLEYQHRQKINETLTEKLHEYATTYYMPIITAASRLNGSLGKLHSTLTAEEKSSQEVEALNLRTLREIIGLFALQRATKPGIFLRTLKAERIVRFLLLSVAREVNEPTCLGRDRRLAILEEKTPTDSNGKFSQRPQSKAVSEAISQFHQWSKAHPEEIHRLQRRVSCCREVFLFELNVSHRGWYRQRMLVGLGKEERDELKILLQEWAKERADEGQCSSWLAKMESWIYFINCCGLRNYRSNPGTVRLSLMEIQKLKLSIGEQLDQEVKAGRRYRWTAKVDYWLYLVRCCGLRGLGPFAWF
jgi:hypothetical protein